MLRAISFLAPLGAAALFVATAQAMTTPMVTCGDEFTVNEIANVLTLVVLGVMASYQRRQERAVRRVDTAVQNVRVQVQDDMATDQTSRTGE